MNYDPNHNFRVDHSESFRALKWVLEHSKEQGNRRVFKGIVNSHQAEQIARLMLLGYKKETETGDQLSINWQGTDGIHEVNLMFNPINQFSTKIFAYWFIR